MVARPVKFGGLTTRNSSNRKKKYHSDAVVCVWRRSLGRARAKHDRERHDDQDHHDAHQPSFAPVGEERLALALQDRVLAEVTPPSRAGSQLFLEQLRLRLGRSHGGAVVRASRRGTDGRRSSPRSARHEQHVDRVEARQRRGAELRATTQEIAQIGADQRTGAVDVDTDDRGPVGALVERQQ